MPLVGRLLGRAIKQAVDNQPPRRDNESVEAYRDRIFEAMGSAIVDYIKRNAVVQVTSVAGVQPGPGVSGPGTGRIL